MKSRLASDLNASEKADEKLQEAKRRPLLESTAGALHAVPCQEQPGQHQPGCRALRLLHSCWAPFSAPCPVAPCQGGFNSNKSTVQNILTAHVPGREEFAASEHRLGFDFDLAVVDSLAAFPEHVEGYAIGQASHRQQLDLLH